MSYTDKRNKIVQKLVSKPITTSYRPTFSGLPAWFSGGSWGQTFDLSAVELMLLDSTVAMGIAMIWGPIFLADGNWEITTDDIRIFRFVNDQLHRFWQYSLDSALPCIQYGYAGSEALYQRKPDGKIHFQILKPIHPRDITALSYQGQYAGFKIHGGTDQPSHAFSHLHAHTTTTILPSEGLLIQNGKVISKDPAIPAKGFWVTHGQSYNPMYGRSRLIGAWIPWRDKNSQDGALDIIRQWYYKNAFTGFRVRHPSKDIVLPGGIIVPARDLARQLAEWMKAGAVCALPSERDPKNPGQYLWEIEDPKLTGNADGLLDYLRYLDNQIMRGLLIPDDVAITGSSAGYSGRKVSEDAFYVQLERIFRTIVSTVNRLIIRPLVFLNYGENAAWNYSIETKPLLPVRQMASVQQAIGQNQSQLGSPTELSQLLNPDHQDNQELEAMRKDNTRMALPTNGHHNYLQYPIRFASPTPNEPTNPQPEPTPT